MSKFKGNLTIFIFPYLFIDKELQLDGYTLKPSYTTTIQNESNRLKGHLTKIAKSFCLKERDSINQYTYGFTTIHNKDEWINLKNFLNTISTLLRFQELTESRGANFSNFDYVVFEISRPMSGKKFDYYEGAFNGINSFSVHYPRTKFCPNFEIRPYILQTEAENKVFNHLFNLRNVYYSKEEGDRYLRALDWFNQSYKSDLEVDELERFISISIAFEALFNSPTESVQSTLSANITTLLGKTPEMENWIKDFYDRRSRIVHGEEKPSTLYRGKGTNEYHMDHLSFSRKVFIRCLSAIFLTREKVYTKDLHNDLISNERRIKEVLSNLNSKLDIKKLYGLKVFDTIDALNQKDATGKMSDVLKIADKIMPLTFKVLNKRKHKELISQLTSLVVSDKENVADLAVKYSEFHVAFSPIYFEDKSLNARDIHKLAFKGAIYNFTSYVSWKLFRDLFNKKS